MSSVLSVPHVAQRSSAKSFDQISRSPVGGYTLTRNAVYYNGHSYVGFVDPGGNVRVGSFNEAKRTWTVSPSIASGLSDWHDSPSILVRSSDKKLVISFAPHDGANLYVAISSNAEDVSAWGAATDISASVGVSEFTYTFLVQLSAESGKIYLFWRNLAAGTATWQFSTSTDGGATWAGKTSLYANSGKQGYLTLDSDGVSRIDFIVGDASANLDAVNTGSAYHFYYDGSYRKSDGTSISTTPPLGPSDLTKIYDGATNGGLYYPSSVVTNTSTPTAVWVAQDTTGAADPLNFWYGHYNAGWTVNKITDDGVAPDPSFAGIIGTCVLDVTDTTIVYLGRYASSVWNAHRYVTANTGSSWTHTALTSDTDVTNANFAVQTVRGSNPPTKAVWLYGPLTSSFSLLQTCIVRGYPVPPL